MEPVLRCARPLDWLSFRRCLIVPSNESMGNEAIISGITGLLVGLKAASDATHGTVIGSALGTAAVFAGVAGAHEGLGDLRPVAPGSMDKDAAGAQTSGADTESSRWS